jgi:hypothetical protein
MACWYCEQGEFAVPDVQAPWQRLESGDVLEYSEDHLVELGLRQFRPEFLQYDRDENRHFLVSERR